MRECRVGLLSTLAAACFALACSGVRPEVRAALTGSLPELRNEIARAEARAPLEGDELSELARAVAEREISSAQGTQGAQTIASFRGCAGRLQSALESRSKGDDEPSAAATLLLFEIGKHNGEELIKRYGSAESGAFRALAARATLASRHAELRRRYLTDPDERVRRGALEAALKAPAPLLLPELLEAARLDPNAVNRARAAQAAGRLGGEPAVLGLMDLFASGDDQERLAILGGWAEPRSFASGGERELARALNRPGLVSVAAATLLLRSRDSRTAALAVLARAIAEGSDDERRVALAAAPLAETEIKLALERAASSPSPALTPLLLSRLTELPGAAPKARAELEKLLQQPDDPGLEAAYALAPLGSLRAVARVQGELTSASSDRRRRAALALAAIGKRERLAARLADESPSVRSALACLLMEAP